MVDAGGKPVPISRLMLHHIVFSNLGEEFGDKRDATCNTFTTLDSKTVIPAVAERFYAVGEERAEMRLPKGYGYPVKGRDRWALTYMMMNHRNRADRAYIQYTDHLRQGEADAGPALLARRSQLPVRSGLRRARRRGGGLHAHEVRELDRARGRAHRRRRRPRARRGEAPDAQPQAAASSTPPSPPGACRATPSTTSGPCCTSPARST